MAGIVTQDRAAHLTAAQLIADTGFGDAEGARITGKRWADHRRRIRDGLEAEQLLASEQVARLQPDAAPPIVPEPSVVRPVRHRGQTAAALKAIAPAPAMPRQSESRVFGALGKLRAVD